MNKIRLTTLSAVLGLGLVLSGCVGGPSTEPVDTVAESPVKTIKGEIRVAGNSFFIDEGTGRSTEIISRKLDLGSYIGNSVEVTGEFSGTTLYVDEIK